ncbi:MAG: peptide ABC transporter substrate-binding protein [Candidatus Eremiobacteraeota bacterium]|nr:peptide ABC transporter substrate-binding protein [Candidatus Eremiobacteraeota bacterium]
MSSYHMMSGIDNRLPNGIRRACAFGMLAAALLTSACGRQAPRVPTVRFNVSADPSSLHPLFAHADAGNVEQQLAHLAFEPFFDLDASGKPVPELLTLVPTVANGGLSRDGRTIVYHLRRVNWSDGVPLTSADVLFTLRAILDPNNSVASREGYDLIDRAEALDPHTVRFHLKRAWAPAVATFFAYGTSPQYVLPAHVLRGRAALARSPFAAAPAVGDGPFTFVEWRRGDRLVYRANARYWRGEPRVKRLEIGIVPDPQANLNLLRAGSLDFNLLAPAQIALVAGTAGIGFVDVPTALIAGLALNTARAPLDDRRVRRALAASLDRGAISRKITLGKYPVSDSDRPRFSWAYDGSIRQPRYDPAAADAALDGAGWRRGADGIRYKNGKPLALVYVQFPESTTGVRVAAFAQRQLHERGFDVTVKSVSNAQLFLPQTGLLASGRFDVAYVPWPMGADPDDRFVLGCERAERNYMHYCDARVARLQADAVRAPDQARRRADYAAQDRIVAEDVPIVYFFNPSYVYAYRTRLRGFAPNAFSPTWNAYAWSVPAPE